MQKLLSKALFDDKHGHHIFVMIKLKIYGVIIGFLAFEENAEDRQERGMEK